MKHSSRNQPCPICGRYTDDKCRWNDSTIFCFYGDSFRPPSSLRINDIATAFGRRWRLVRLDGGFSGGSYVFIPFVESDKLKSFTPSELEKRKERLRETGEKFKKRFNLLRKKVHACYGVIDFHRQSLQELRDTKTLLLETLNECSDLLRVLMSNRNAIDRQVKIRFALLEWQKRIQHRKKDLFDFVRQNLM